MNEGWAVMFGDSLIDFQGIDCGCDIDRAAKFCLYQDADKLADSVPGARVVSIDY